jgi:hypothetical protein
LAAAYDAPRVQLCDFPEKLCEKKGQARGDDAAAEKNGHASWKRAAWGVTLQKAMAGLREPGESRVRYFWTRSSGSCSYPAAATPSSEQRRRRDKDDAEGGGIGVVVARKANEMDMASYSSLASSSSS